MEKMRGLPIEIRKPADQLLSIRLAFEMPKCWCKLLLDKCILLCPFCPVVPHVHCSV